VPGGRSTLASYAAALFLLKEKYSLSNSTINKILRECNIDPLDFLEEGCYWYVLENKQLSPGIYRLREERISNLDEMLLPKDQVRVEDDAYPVGEILGLDIYEVTHINSGQPVYVTVGELYK